MIHERADSSGSLNCAVRSRIVVPVGIPPIEDGVLVVERGKIQTVARWSEWPGHSRYPVVDLGETILLPGFVNCHCHLDYTALAGTIPPPRNFAGWLDAIVTLKAKRELSDYRRSWIAGARMLERSGVGSVLDIEAVPELLPEVWNATSLRVWSCLELIDLRSPENPVSLMAAAEKRRRRLNRTRSNHCGLAPHALYTASDELLRLAADAGGLFTVHAAESEAERDMYLTASGPLHSWLERWGPVNRAGEGSPITLLERTGALRRRPIIAHANYLSPGEEDLLAQGQATVVHCPRSHRYFGHDPFPWERLQKAEVNIALGTDSLASCPANQGGQPVLDYFLELTTAANSHPTLSPTILLNWATVNGAKALGQAQNLGKLLPQYQADFTAINYHGRTNEACEAIVYHQGEPAAAAVNGRWTIPPAT